MGANLTGYLVKGPYTMTSSPELEDLVSSMKSDLDSVKDMTYHDFEDVPDWIKHYMDCRGTYFPVGNDRIKSLELGEIPEQFAGTVQDVISRLLCFWNEMDYSDVAIRMDPDDEDQCLVFAGDMSWGDKPTGTGYTMLELLMTTPLGAVLGIR